MTKEPIIPYRMLSKEQQALVDAYVEDEIKKHCKQNPDGVIKAAELRAVFREEACTQKKLESLLRQQEKKRGPFAPVPNPRPEESPLQIQDWGALEEILGEEAARYYRDMVKKKPPSGEIKK